MKTVNTSQIGEKLYSAILRACRSIEPCALAEIERAYQAEENPLSKFALKSVIDNAKIARQTNLPVCQDTGLAVFMVKIGSKVILEGEFLGTVINKAVKKAYADGLFRNSVCDPLTRQNTGDNTPAVINYEYVEGDCVTVDFMPKGFGSENMSKIFMLSPKEGADGIISAVVSAVKEAGGMPCPPVFVGVGIGGSFEKAAVLAKTALLRRVGVFSMREDLAQIEKVCLEKINMLGIGAQGFGGSVTALHVAAECFPTHIAGLPVAVNIQCHAIRHITVEV